MKTYHYVIQTLIGGETINENCLITEEKILEQYKPLFMAEFFSREDIDAYSDEMCIRDFCSVYEANLVE